MAKERNLKLGNFEIVCWKDFPCFMLKFAKCGYFDGRPEIKIGAIFWTFIIKLPFVNQELQYECDAPEYGISIHDNSFWMHCGTKLFVWHIPFATRCFYKHEVLGDCSWIDVTDKEGRKRVGYLEYEDRNKPTDAVVFRGIWKDFDGEEVPAIYRLERRTWRRKWLMWTNLFDHQCTQINISFKSEVGKNKHSWKGGVYGIGFELKPNETVQECFERVNRENHL